MPEDNPRESEALSGRYRLTKQVADDEAGGLWVGLDDRTGREVVVRVLRPAVVGADVAALLGRAAALSHESILPILTFDLEAATPHVVYGGVEGKPLTAFIAEGDIPWDSACEIASQLLEALVHVHEQGLVFGPLRPQSVWLTGDGRAVLGDVGLHAGPASPSRGEQEPLAGGSERTNGATPRSDLAALGSLLQLLIRSPESAPTAVQDFIARCRGDSAAPPFTDARQARDALQETMRRELAQATSTPRPDTPVPAQAAPRDDDVGARIRQLERQLRRSGPAPELEAEIERLRAAHGSAQLDPLAGLKGRAILGCHDAANKITIAVFVAGCALGFGLLWWIVGAYLRTVPLTETLRMTLTYLALAAYLVVGVWVAVALLITRTRRACYVVITESEVICRDESKGLVMATVSATDIRSVTLVSFDEKAPERTVADIEIWGGGRLRLDFSARAHEDARRGGS